LLASFGHPPLPLVVILISHKEPPKQLHWLMH
jgi:hypothetical protein